MSRRRNKTTISPEPQPPPQSNRRRNTSAERPLLNITIGFLAEGKVEVDPKYNNALIEQLDVICGDSEDFDVNWTNDHKIAYYIWLLMDGFLSEWDPPVAREEVDATIPEVPHLKDAPVVDRFNLSDMEILKK
jgi:hypothetical protein